MSFKIDCLSLMLNQLHGFMKKGLFTDVTFVVGDAKFKAHKAILASSSTVFQTMFEADFDEAASDKIILSDVSEEVFSAFLDYIYIQDVKVVEKYPRQMIMLADKYDIEPLAISCDGLIGESLDVKNAVDTLLFADLYRRYALKAKVTSYIKEHLETVLLHDSWAKLEENFDIVDDMVYSFLVGEDANRAYGGNEVTWILKDRASWYGVSQVKPRIELSFEVALPHRITIEASLICVNSSLAVQVHVNNKHNELVWSTFEITQSCTRSQCKGSANISVYWAPCSTSETKYYVPTMTNDFLYPLTITVAVNRCHPIHRHLYVKNVRDERFADASLVVPNMKVPVHKLVLAGKSAFFSDLFDRNEKEYKIEGVTAATLNLLVDYMYLGSNPPSAKIDSHLLRAAKQFKLDMLVEHCVDTLQKTVSHENAIELCTTADDLGLKTLESAVMDFISKEPLKVVNSEKWRDIKNHKRLMKSIILKICPQVRS